MLRSYSLEFRRRVVDLCGFGGRWPHEVAEEFGVSEAIVYRWIAQDEVDLGERSGVRSGERAELSEARARIKELEGELELTRKAAAIFEEQEGRRVVRPKDLPGDRVSGRAGTLSESVLRTAERCAVGLLLLEDAATVDPPVAPGTARRSRRGHSPRFKRYLREAQDHR
jgi:transposase